MEISMCGSAGPYSEITYHSDINGNFEWNLEGLNDFLIYSNLAFFYTKK